MKLGPSKAPTPPISPPNMLLAPPVTFPIAIDWNTLPSSAPLNPPAKLAAPTLTSPLAVDALMVALLLFPSPTVQPPQLPLLLLGLLPPVKPPAMLLSPALTAP